MIYGVLCFMCALAEIAAIPMFLRYYWPGRSKKSFSWKVVASGLFVLVGFFAMKASGNNTPYSNYIICGLILGFAGDLLLHAISQKMVYLVSGVLAFLAGHIFYVMAIQKAIKTTYPDAAVFEWFEILAIVLMVVVSLGYLLIRKHIKRDNIPILVGLSGYLVFLTTMLVKAFRFVIGEWVYGTNDNVAALFITICLGAILFFTSDITLGLMMLNKEIFETRLVRVFNIVTYYIAQILIGSSIFFVQSFEIFGK